MSAHRDARRLAVCLAASLAYCAAVSSAHAEAWIAGRVFYLDDGQERPVSGVAVLAEDDRKLLASGETDEDGRYVLGRLPLARFDVTVRAVGWKTVRAGPIEHDSLRFDCSAGGDCGSMDFELTRGAALTGMVVDEFGEPAIGATVYARRMNRSERAVEHLGKADDRGTYRIVGLLPGDYEIDAGLYPMDTLEFGYEYASARTTVEIGSGGEVQASSLTLRLLRKRRIAGRVEGLEAEEGSITFRMVDRTNRVCCHGEYSLPVARFGSDGRFRSEHVPDGRLDAWYDPPGRPRLFLGTVEVSQDIDELVLRPATLGRVRGRVLWEGPPVHRAIRLQLGNPRSGQSVEAGPPDWDFEADGLVPGAYEIGVGHDEIHDAIYVRPAGQGGSLHGRPAVWVEAGEVRELTIAAGAEFASLRGNLRIVSDGEISAAAHFVLALTQPRFLRLLAADQFGRVDADRLTPGEYVVCASRKPSAMDWSSEDACAAAGLEGRRIVLDPGSGVSIDLTVRP